MIHPVSDIPTVWRIIGASVTGTSHLARGLGCQDAHGIRHLAKEVTVIAVADGAGSAGRASEGSELAVKSSLDSLCASLENVPDLPDTSLADALRGALIAARTSLTEMAGAEEDDADAGHASDSLDQFATTLILVVLAKRWLGIAQVGDGAAVVRDAEGSLQVLTIPSSGEYLNETFFLTSPDYLQKSHIRVWPLSADALAVMSDGVQVLAINYADNTAHAPFFEPIFRFASNAHTSEDELRSFLESPKVCAHTDDDKTLVVAIRTDGTVLS